MKDSISLEKLNDLIESGTTIYKIDESKGKIYIIEGIDVSGMEPDVLISKYNIDFTSALRKFITTEKFYNARYHPVKRGVILIDVVNYSKGDSLYFASILTVFNTIINHILKKLKTVNKLVEQIIPTGDGCYLVFNENLNDSFFKIVVIIINEMNNMQNITLKKFSKDQDCKSNLHLRLSCTLNETDFFCDIAGNRNCYGIALNEAARILNSGQDELSKRFPDDNSVDVVFFDKTVIDQASSLVSSIVTDNSNMPSIIDLGQVADKHNLKRQIWCLKDIPLDQMLDLYIIDNHY